MFLHGGGKNKKDQESQREFVILHQPCFCSGKNIFLKGEMHAVTKEKQTDHHSSELTFVQ